MRQGADSPHEQKNGGISPSDHAAQRTKHTIKQLVHIREIVALAKVFFVENGRTFDKRHGQMKGNDLVFVVYIYCVCW